MDSEPHKPPRRKRYPGTHPRRFDQRYKELDPPSHPGIVEHVRAQGRTPAGTHVPVLLAEVVEALRPAPGEVVADCTLGHGGHAQEFLQRIAPGGRLIGFDVDGSQLERTRLRLAGLGWEITAVRGNFAGLAKPLASEGLDGYDVVLADLGASSMQLDDPGRGFSYKHDGPLDMRMDDRTPQSAADLVMTLPAEELSQALLQLADEEDHERIARAIVQRRSKRPIRTTAELADVVLGAKGPGRGTGRERSPEEGGPHPAARTFQALRIMVNDELGSLRQLLRVAPFCLSPGGRIGIISFHSGEDRLVKHAFRDGVRQGVYQAASPEVIRPSPQEVRDNPRSAPAKLRWARKP